LSGVVGAITTQPSLVNPEATRHPPRADYSEFAALRAGQGTAERFGRRSPRIAAEKSAPAQRLFVGCAL
jgi:hypothetical protein